MKTLWLILFLHLMSLTMLVQSRRNDKRHKNAHRDGKKGFLYWPSWTQEAVGIGGGTDPGSKTSGTRILPQPNSKGVRLKKPGSKSSNPTRRTTITAVTPATVVKTTTINTNPIPHSTPTPTVKYSRPSTKSKTGTPKSKTGTPACKVTSTRKSKSVATIVLTVSIKPIDLSTVKVTPTVHSAKKPRPSPGTTGKVKSNLPSTRKSKRPTLATTRKIKPTPIKPSATKRNVRTTKKPHKPETTRKPKGKNKALEGLLKNKVNKDNAKDVAKNLTKVFEGTRPKDMTKEDADAAADVLENIVSIKDKLNETAGNVVEFIDSFMEMNKTTLADSGAAASKIIKVLDKLVEYIPFDKNSTSLKINKTNIVIQANLVNPESFEGISFGINSNSRRRRSTGRGITRDQYSINLPRAVVMDTNASSVRIGFIYYAYNKLFQANGSQGEPSETVLSGSVYGADVNNLTQPVVIRLPGRHGDDKKTTQCVFWVESARQWSNTGCSLCPKQPSDESVECCCNHLTSFAVLFSPDKKTEDGVHAKILSIISYVGCIISIIGVVLTFLTYSMFRHLRKTNQQPILMNLCIAIALLLIVFVAGINSTNTPGCQIVAVLLHYLTLVTVLWMGIEAYNLYLQIVKVMAIYQRKFMLKAAIVGWGTPLIIVLATLGAAIFQYKQQDGNMAFYYGSNQVCILHNQLYRLISWFGPVLVIILLNFIAFVLIVYKLNSRHCMIPAEPKSQTIKNCWTALAIMCLLGLTWLFGALAISDARITFEYLFCIFNSLQGFFIFFFHCVRIKEVRSQWSFFVSGLGFSHGDSDNSHQKSRGMEKLRKDSDSVCMHKTANVHHGHQREQPKRKITVVTMVGEEGSGHSNTVEGDGKTFSDCSHYSTEF